MQASSYSRELVEFFQFFQEWFSGTSPNTDDHYSRITNVIPDDGTYINPKGKLMPTASFFSGLRSAHGSSPEMKMWVENVELQWEVGELALVTFEEWMQGSNAESSGRMSTTIFRKNPQAPNGIEWLHVHETMLPKLET